jgi:TolB protein
MCPAPDGQQQCGHRWRLALALCLGACAGLAHRSATAQESIEGKFLTDVHQVTDGFVKAGEGYFSPDAKEIAYQAVPRDYPFYQIYRQPLAGGVPHRVSTGRGRTTCVSYRPDGKKLIFASSHLDPQLEKTEDAERQQQADDAKTGRRRRYEWNFDPFMDIFESNLDGTELRQLTDSSGYDAEGSYSPDGKQIVFCSTRDGDPDIYLMNADGSNLRQLTNAPGYDGGPFISPDGKWVVFRSDRDKEGFLQIYVIGTDGTHETPLTSNPNSVNWAPYWHPTKPYIIWTGADHTDPQARPNYDLWLMRYEKKDGQITPGPITRITDNPTADVLPVFSPDGKRLMWTSNRTADHASQLFLGTFNLPE